MSGYDDVNGARHYDAAYPLSRRRTPTPQLPGLVLGLLLAVGGAAGTWLTWRYFVDTAEGQLLDDTAFRGSAIGRSTLWQAVEPVLDVIDVPFVVVALGTAALIAVVRRRWFLAVQVAVLVGGANLTTQVLKHTVLDRPTLTETVGAAQNSLPSGHTTVAASVAAALVLVAPRRLRPLVAFAGAGYAALTGVSTMVGGWHRPSDVVAAVTVVVAWAGLTTMLTAATAPPRGVEVRGGTAGTVIVTLMLLAGAGVAGALAASALFTIRDRLAADPWLDGGADLGAAYAGGAFGVVAVTAASFAAVLVAHHVAERGRPTPDDTPTTTPVLASRRPLA